MVVVAVVVTALAVAMVMVAVAIALWCLGLEPYTALHTSISRSGFGGFELGSILARTSNLTVDMVTLSPRHRIPTIRKTVLIDPRMMIKWRD